MSDKNVLLVNLVKLINKRAYQLWEFVNKLLVQGKYMQNIFF
jgi:hypothetical protein